jgi:hypothetical protein
MNYNEWADIGHANGWLDVRRSDSKTSTEGAKDVTIRAGSQRTKLLETYASCVYSITDEVAGVLSGLAEKNAGYWKRCSELRRAGYIEPTGEMRESSTGSMQQCCRITDAGRQAVERIS